MKKKGFIYYILKNNSAVYSNEQKKAKISYDRLTRTYQEGGLQLNDLELKDKALKIKWVQELRHNESVFKELVKGMLPINLDTFWKCNLSVKDTKKLFHVSMFSDIFIAWSYFNHHTPTSEKQIMNQCIWYNSFIKDKCHLYYYSSGSL